MRYPFETYDQGRRPDDVCGELRSTMSPNVISGLTLSASLVRILGDQASMKDLTARALSRASAFGSMLDVADRCSLLEPEIESTLVKAHSLPREKGGSF